MNSYIFEKYQTEYKFGAIFSATAFHWLDLSIKYKKSYDLLNDDGLLILFWNNYGIENNEMENEIQKIYTKYGKGIKDGKSSYEKQIESRKIEIEFELKTWLTLSSINGIVEAILIVKINEIPCIISKWMDNGNLRSYINKKDKTLFYNNIIII